jgi:hypothetical protein
MGLVLDEPRENDQKIESEGFSFVVASDVADMIRSYGNVLIDYKDHLWTKGFHVTFPGRGPC